MLPRMRQRHPSRGRGGWPAPPRLARGSGGVRVAMPRNDRWPAIGNAAALPDPRGRGGPEPCGRSGRSIGTETGTLHRDGVAATHPGHAHCCAHAPARSRKRSVVWVSGNTSSAAAGTRRCKRCRFIPSSDENTEIPTGGDVEIPARRRLIRHHLTMKTTGQITLTYICAAFGGQTSRSDRNKSRTAAAAFRVQAGSQAAKRVIMVMPTSVARSIAVKTGIASSRPTPRRMSRCGDSRPAAIISSIAP